MEELARKDLTRRKSPRLLPGHSRDELPRLFRDMGYAVGAEIGVFKGGFSKKLCEAGLMVFAIDSWLATPEHLAVDPMYQRKRNAIYRSAVANLVGCECEIFRKTSMEALDDFEEGSLDFVHIDANHGFKDFSQDLCGWDRKVRSGGVVSGHDYFLSSRCQVGPVVDAYVRAFGITPWYVIGIGDEKPSWFWVKK
jgi:hypothetical protein